MKRLFDICVSFFCLMSFAPILIVAMIAVWLQDFKSPFYVPYRVGKDGRPFKMIKLRSMVVGADKNCVDSTSSEDARITFVGRLIRKFKLDELIQMWNVFTGDMSLVGPRPNVQREVDLYTAVERGMLYVKPGITDIASIVFADEGDVLKECKDPDIGYNQLIRPWKSRLALLYVEKTNFVLDIQLLFLTAVTIVSRSTALNLLQTVLRQINADELLIAVASRKNPLIPYPPPGATEIVTARQFKQTSAQEAVSAPL